MSSIGPKRRRRGAPTYPAEPKMDMLLLSQLDHHPPRSFPPLPQCCATADCCNFTSIECTDQQCQQLLDEYCQDCLDLQACHDPTCSIQCEECCEESSCTDTSTTQVTFSPINKKVRKMLT